MSQRNEQNSRSKQPTHFAYHVKEGREKGYWTRIGAAWPHSDGKGFNIQIEVVPLDGRITLRVPEPNEK